jgi:hypothetical protein
MVQVVYIDGGHAGIAYEGVKDDMLEKEDQLRRVQVRGVAMRWVLEFQKQLEIGNFVHPTSPHQNSLSTKD